jgi:aryl-alcohol dehydrogenase-like predicted oxidoreductase
MSRLALGTAQFGLDYGITNPAGRVAEEDAAAILDLASRCGIDMIDTARQYGESEGIIGRNWPDRADFRVVTKIGKLNEAAADSVAERVRSDFAASLEALRQARIYALLVHDTRHLRGPAEEPWSALEHLKKAGLVQKIGVSVYESEEIDAIVGRYPIDVVQLPFNAVDQRLAIGGQLEKLARAGIEVHARSVFLQGLLLAPATHIPDKFAPIRSAVEQLDVEFASRGLSRLQGLLATVFSRSEIDRCIVGVTSTAELEAILAAERRTEHMGPIDLDLPAIDALYLNPARWSELL